MDDLAAWQRGRGRHLLWLRLAMTLAALPTAFSIEFLLLAALGGRAALVAFTSGLSAPGKVKAACAAQHAAACGTNLPLWMMIALLAAPIVVTVWTAWFAGKGAAQGIYDRFFASLDRDRFDVLPPPRDAAGAAIPLPWVFDAAGARRAIWQQLEDFTVDSDFRTREARFAWTMLTGQPGMGKTRLAQEFARALADPAYPGRPPPRPAFGRWLGRVVPFMRTQPNDLWDVGVLRRGASVHGWRPTRATLLLLDDPGLGESDAWIDRLAAARIDYRFPVRLIIVNQSRATDRAAVGDAGRLSPFGSSFRLAREDVRGMLVALSDQPPVEQPWGGAIRSLLMPDAALAAVMTVTRGNPFLVELCIDWARAQAIEAGEARPTRELRARVVEALATLKAADLIQQRAQRVIEALKVAGIGDADPSRLYAIAAATLVGPRARRRPIVDMLDARSLPQGDALRGIVPGDDRFDAYTELPCIQPPVIGDAAVRQMLETGDSWRNLADRQAQIEQIVDAGFAAGPYGWIAAQRRFAGRTGPLADALRRPPTLPPDAPIELRRTVAANVLELGLFGYLPPLAASEMLEALITGAPATVQAEAVALLQAQFDATVERDTAAREASLRGPPPDPSGERDEEDDPFHGFILGEALQLLGLTLLAQTTDVDATVTTIELCFEPMVALAHEVTRRGVPEPGPGVIVRGILMAEVWMRRRASAYSPDALLEQLRAMQRAGCWQFNRVVFNALSAIVGAVEKPASCVRLNALRAYVDPERLDACRRAVEKVEAIAQRRTFTHDHAVQIDRALAWRSLAYAESGDVIRCLDAVDHVEAIAERDAFNDDSDMQLELVAAQRILAFARREDVVSCREAVDRVETLATRASVVSDRNIQCERATAWRMLAFALDKDAVSCREAVDHVETIAARALFVTDRNIQLERATAWCSLAFALQEDAGRCRGAVDHVEAIAAREVFAHDQEIQRVRAESWRRLAGVFEEDPVRCGEVINHLESFTARPAFATVAEIQVERVAAWCFLAGSLKANASGCRSAIDHVESIVTNVAFTDDENMQFLRTLAWGVLAKALRTDAFRCRHAVDRIEAVAVRAAFASDRGIQHQRAAAWCHLCYATRTDPVHYREALAYLATVASLPEYVADADVQEQLRLARSYAVSPSS